MKRYRTFISTKFTELSLRFSLPLRSDNSLNGAFFAKNFHHFSNSRSFLQSAESCPQVFHEARKRQIIFGRKFLQNLTQILFAELFIFQFFNERVDDI